MALTGFLGKLGGIKDSLVGGAIGGAISGLVQSAISGIQSLVQETMEYQKIMGVLEASSQKAGYTADQTAQSYRQLYQVIGEDQASATALANLQALGLSQSDLTTLIDAPSEPGQPMGIPFLLTACQRPSMRPFRRGR